MTANSPSSGSATPSASSHPTSFAAGRGVRLSAFPRGRLSGIRQAAGRWWLNSYALRASPVLYGGRGSAASSGELCATGEGHRGLAKDGRGHVRGTSHPDKAEQHARGWQWPDGRWGHVGVSYPSSFASPQPASPTTAAPGRRLGQLYLLNVRRVTSVVAVPRPDGNDSDVCDFRPRGSFPAIGILIVVRGHSRILYGILYLLGVALKLHRLLVIPTDHKRYFAIPPEIRVLARRYKRVEDDLSVIRGRDSDQGRLRLCTFVRRR
jgi:hypothetical protein